MNNDDDSSKLKNITQEEFELEISKIEEEKRFSDVDMSEIDFDNKNCNEVIFENIIIDNKKIINALFDNSRFINCTICETIFNSCSFNNAGFIKSEIMQTEFYRARLQNAYFEKVDLSDSRIKHCMINGLDFSSTSDIPRTIEPDTISWPKITLPKNFSKINLGGQIFIYDYPNDRVIIRNNDEFGKVRITSCDFEDFKKERLLEVYDYVVKLFEYHKFIMRARNF